MSELAPGALDATTKRAQKEAITAEIRKWPAEKIAGLMPTVELARMAVTAIRARLRECLEQDPASVPGYRLRETNGPRSASAAVVWQHIEDLGLSTPEFLGCCSLSVPKLEKVVGVDTLRTTLAEDVIQRPVINKLEKE